MLMMIIINIIVMMLNSRGIPTDKYIRLYLSVGIHKIDEERWSRPI